MIEIPLTRANRTLLAAAFNGQKRVDLGIDSAIEGEMGRVFVDRMENPTAFVVEQGELFCYFAGDPRAASGRDLIGQLPRRRLLMPSEPDWLAVAQEIYADQLVRTRRFSFSSLALSAEVLERLLQKSSLSQQVQRVDVPAAGMPSSLVKLWNFGSAEDFVARGIGYCLVHGNRMRGAVYSSLVSSSGIEVSIYVQPDYRRRGVATVLASHLLIWCLERNLEPHWDAANLESCRLAEKLGYVQTGTYDAYFLTDYPVQSTLS